MFISCWVTMLMLQNSHDASSVPNNGFSVNNKRPFVPVKHLHHINVPMNATVTDYKNSLGKKPHFPSKTLLSTKEHLATNKTNLNKTNLNSTKRSEMVHTARIDSIPSMNGPDSLEMLRNELVTLNKEERIHNAEKFAPLGSDDIILIVQVHKRVGYLRQLLNSLRAVRGIDEVLLVVSSDYFFEELNQVVQSVDFCKVGVCVLLFVLTHLDISWCVDLVNFC